MKTLDIIIPIYNEERTLEKVIAKIEDINFENLKTEIIFVDDGSSDNSKSIINKYPQYKVFSHPKNLGKGAAIRSGLKISTSDIKIIQDADLEYDPKDYEKLLKYILSEEAQVVYGSRFKSSNYKNKFLFLSFLANKFLTFLTNLLFNSKLTDVETCYKVFTKEAIKDIEFKSNKFEFEIEITAKLLKKGIKITEIPIIYNCRKALHGKKITALDGLHAIFAIIYYRFFN